MRSADNWGRSSRRHWKGSIWWWSFRACIRPYCACSVRGSYWGYSYMCSCRQSHKIPWHLRRRWSSTLSCRICQSISSIDSCVMVCMAVTSMCLSWRGKVRIFGIFCVCIWRMNYCFYLVNRIVRRVDRYVHLHRACYLLESLLCRTPLHCCTPKYPLNLQHFSKTQLLNSTHSCSFLRRLQWFQKTQCESK